MSRVEKAPQVVPSFEIVSMRIRKGRDILLKVDLNTEDPNLANPGPRNFRAVLEGIRSCEQWNKEREAAIVEGRFNFKTGKITPLIAEDGSERTQPYPKAVCRVFVRRAAPIADKPRSRLTRLPERHADNYPVVTGHHPSQLSNRIRRPYERWHIWEPGPNGEYGRPVIPSRILKAPKIIRTPAPEDLELVEMRKSVIGAQTLSGLHKNGVSPHSLFKVQESAAFTVQRR